MSKVPVTVCIIAKNEENFIEGCLKRLIPYGMEIIVADTGSDDRTREIAQAYADKVVDFEWINDFSAARNYCASFASNNWILALDCDEYVNSIDIRVMRMLMQKHPRHTGIIRIKNLINCDNGETAYEISDVTRMYNKNYYAFDYAIHEQVCAKDPEKRQEALDGFLLPMEVVHHGYALDKERMKEKQRRNLEILYRDLENAEKSGTGQDKAYLYFQIARSEITIGNQEKAIEAYESGERLITPDDMEKPYIAELIMALSGAYVESGRTQDAVALMDRYAEYFKIAKFVLVHANVYFEAGQLLPALGNYLKATMMKDAGTLGDGLRTCYGRIINIYEALGQNDMAEMFHKKFLECDAEKERLVNSQNE